MYAKALETFRSGGTEDSREGLEQSRAAFLAQGEERKAAQVANDLGVVYSLTGRLDRARMLFAEAQTVFEKEGDTAGLARAIGNQAQMMNKAGDKEEAAKGYLRAAELFARAGDREDEYHTYRALSQMELQRGRWLEALATFDRALAAKGGSRLLRWFLQIPLRLAGLRK
jgi:tetratricopeptide (TPR) repeat protein